METNNKVEFKIDAIDKIVQHFIENPDDILDIKIFYDSILKNNYEIFNILREIPYKHLNVSIDSNLPFNEIYLTEKNDNLLSLFDTSCKIVYDFKNFINLRKLTLYHIKGTKNYDSLCNLNYLRLNKYDKKNLIDFDNLNKLETLMIAQGKVENIENINKFMKLKILWLGYFKNLKMDKNLIFSSIEELNITSCPNVNIEDIPYVFPNLKKLTLSNFKNVETLKPIFENLNSLEYFNFAESKLLESDNRYWKNYPNVKINFMNQKDFLLKRKDFGLI